CRRMPLLPWHYRSPLLRRSRVSLFWMVHTQGTWSAPWYLLLRSHVVWRFWRSLRRWYRSCLQEQQNRELEMAVHHRGSRDCCFRPRYRLHHPGLAGNHEVAIRRREGNCCGPSNGRCWRRRSGDRREGSLHDGSERLPCLALCSWTALCPGCCVFDQLPPHARQELRLQHHSHSPPDRSAIHCNGLLLSSQQLVVRSRRYPLLLHHGPNPCCDRRYCHYDGHDQCRSPVLCPVPDASGNLRLLPDLERLDGQYRRSPAEEARHRPCDEQ
ncbi:hypothetical protein LTS18_001362, partial [Coniosporium uncinatum]